MGADANIQAVKDITPHSPAGTRNYIASKGERATAYHGGINNVAVQHGGRCADWVRRPLAAWVGKSAVDGKPTAKVEIKEIFASPEGNVTTFMKYTATIVAGKPWEGHGFHKCTFDSNGNITDYTNAPLEIDSFEAAFAP